MNQPIVIIAEAGVNHNGDIELAKKLIDVAAESGADYVKFQTFIAENCISATAVKADYQIENTGKKNETQLEMVKKLELSYDNHFDLINHCKSKNIKFISTAFDFDSIDFLDGKIDFFKIPSGEITNLPYLEKVANLNLDIVMSTGMADMKEVKTAYNVLIENGVKHEQITILHCNTQYPTPMEDVNLKAMLTIGNELNVKYGYSDHTLGVEIPIAAATLGATVIEKHFTLDRTMDGPDHMASLEPHELKSMVSGIRNIEKALGNGIKAPSESEQKNIKIARKSIIASKKIKKGDVFTDQNLTVKRPGTGISPMKWHEVIGTKSLRDYNSDDLI